MRFNKTILSLAVVAWLALIPLSAQAQVDPTCAAATQAPTLDLTGGTASLCLSKAGENGVAIPDTETLDCTVTFLDGSGAQIGSQSVSGGPGTLHPLSIPQDGTGSAVSVCTLASNGSTSNPAAGTVAVVFPPIPVPNEPEAPIILE